MGIFYICQGAVQTGENGSEIVNSSIRAYNVREIWFINLDVKCSAGILSDVSKNTALVVITHLSKSTDLEKVIWRKPTWVVTLNIFNKNK